MACTSKTRIAAGIVGNWGLLWWKFSVRLRQQATPKHTSQLLDNLPANS